MRGCPLGIDIPGFIRFLREGDATLALSRIKEKNPLPAVCGRICTAPCEVECVFHEEKSAIGIRHLERFASDFGRLKAARPKITPNHKKIAVIGSGPSGLCASYDLARQGYQVTIFEALTEPGGILRYGIPEFRLPKKILDQEIFDLKMLGVNITTNAFVGQNVSVKEIFAKGFEVVLLAMGAGGAGCCELPGTHLAGVYYAQEFLMRVNLWGAEHFPRAPIPAALGNKIVVLGANYAALDCARSVLRLGKQATVVFSGLEEDIEIYPEDLKIAKEEGIVLEPMAKPIEIISSDNQSVSGLKCQRLDFVDGDEQLGWKLELVPDSEFTLQADTVLLADGTGRGTTLSNHFSELQLNDDGTIWVEAQSAMTSVKGVFACGNLVSGAGFVVDAMASGKQAAVKIQQFLNRKS